MSGGVLCCGNLVFDTLVRPVDDAPWGATTIVETIESHIGGNGANTSFALATLGTPVRLLGAVGRDDQGKFLVDSLRNAGVDTSCIDTAAEPTAATVAIVNAAGDRKFLHRPGASTTAFAAPIDFPAAVAAGFRYYHMCSLFILPNLRSQAGDVLRRARAAGLTTSLDTNWDSRGRWLLDLEPCLPHLDFMFVNEDEARMITGRSHPALAAHLLLDRGVHVAVMKLGARGCDIYDDTHQLRCPAFDVEAKDTTGAGDCFVAGFLSALWRGAALHEAGLFANAVGALSVQRVGGVAGMVPYDAVRAWMKTAKLRVREART